MLKKLKDILGIEGVKIDVNIPNEAQYADGIIDGVIILSALSDQTVQEIEIKLMEKYRRGRGDNKLINEYLLGSLVITKNIFISKNTEEKIRFELKFNPMLSDMDKIQRDNFLIGGLVKLAKGFKGVKSTFRIEATAKVLGVKFNPVINKEITID